MHHNKARQVRSQQAMTAWYLSHSNILRALKVECIPMVGLVEINPKESASPDVKRLMMLQKGKLRWVDNFQMW